MSERTIPESLPGYKKDSTIIITYNIPSGLQGVGHHNMSYTTSSHGLVARMHNLHASEPWVRISEQSVMVAGSHSALTRS